MFVRWDNLTVGADEQARLPGYRDGAIVRRFDAPEALDTRFYEIRARSALNRVPEASAVPFRWTINPYRGCSHACAYCLHGDTPILMGDGRPRRMADLQVGDEIYGTVRDGDDRRYVRTTVLDRWSSIKAAYRVTLEDGTQLVASGDHRFLARRGWKHVAGDDQGAGRRPHLTGNDVLLGTGAFASTPAASAGYRRGYVCGSVRADGHIGSHRHEHEDRGGASAHRFRRALADVEARARADAFLCDEGLAAGRLAFSAAAETHRATIAIPASARAEVGAIGALIRWPLDPSEDWCRGYLAGVFDAQGSCDRGILRIGGTGVAIVAWILSSLDRLGFRHHVEDRGPANGPRTVRLLGGLEERLRFLHLVDPAITRRRDIQGTALEAAGSRRVATVEPLGVAMRLHDITTGTGDFIADGIVSHNCFARPTHKYLDFDAGRDFEREIVVKVNVPEVLRAELRRPSWKGEHVAMGTNTDPYQWVEGRYRLMPGIWEALRDARNPCSVLTKSPLLLRDLALLREIAAVTDVSASFSVPTLDEKAWRASEPHSPHPRARLEAVGELNRAGIPCGILVAPLMPGINDAPEQVERILELAAENGATGVSGIALHLRGDVRTVFMDWLRSYRPDLMDRYEELYARGAYAPRAERERLMALVRDGRMPAWPSPRRDHRGARRRTAAAADPRRPPPRHGPVQQALF